MNPLVLSTWQSPRLLEILSRAPQWALQVKYEDRPAFEGNELMQLRRWGGSAPSAVLVCTLDDQEWVLAQPWGASAKTIWVFHNNQPATCPPGAVVEDFVVLSNRALRVWGERLPDARGFVICPSYEATPGWGWRADLPWACLDRPWHRHPRQLEMIAETLDRAGQTANFRMYGQGQPLGYLSGEARRTIDAACSSYVSPLPPWSGFGLAQHECFAAGVPVVGTLWGDLDSEMPAEYGLDDSVTALGERLARLCADEPLARRTSEIGLDFIATHRTFQRMCANVQHVVDSVLGGTP